MKKKIFVPNVNKQNRKCMYANRPARILTAAHTVSAHFKLCESLQYLLYNNSYIMEQHMGYHTFEYFLHQLSS